MELAAVKQYPTEQSTPSYSDWNPLTSSKNHAVSPCCRAHVNGFEHQVLAAVHMLCSQGLTGMITVDMQEHRLRSAQCCC